MQTETIEAQPLPAAPVRKIGSVSGGLPVIGHLLEINRDALGLLRRGREQFGPAFRINHGFGWKPIWLCGDDAYPLLKNEKVDSSAAGDYLEHFIKGSFAELDGAPHRRVRGCFSGPLSPAGMKHAQVGNDIAAAAASHLAGWQNTDNVCPLPSMSDYALNVLFRIIGVEVDDLAQWHREFYKLSGTMIPMSEKIPGSPKWRAGRARSWLQDRLRQLIAEARKDPARSGLLGALVKESEDAATGRVTEQELVDSLLLLTFAGHETSASVMSWMMIQLAARPDFWERLCAEAHAADGPPLEPAAIARFPFAEALFREVVRKYPPAWFTLRTATVDFEFADALIPKGTMLFFGLIEMLNDSDRYVAPDTFDPERWVGREQGQTPIENAAFGGGPHFCVGYRVALLEAVHFFVAAARSVSARGLCPELVGPIPKPTYLPITTHPPHKTKVRFVKRAMSSRGV